MNLPPAARNGWTTGAHPERSPSPSQYFDDDREDRFGAAGIVPRNRRTLATTPIPAKYQSLRSLSASPARPRRRRDALSAFRPTEVGPAIEPRSRGAPQSSTNEGFQLAEAGSMAETMTMRTIYGQQRAVLNTSWPGVGSRTLNDGALVQTVRSNLHYVMGINHELSFAANGATRVESVAPSNRHGKRGLRQAPGRRHEQYEAVVTASPEVLPRSRW